MGMNDLGNRIMTKMNTKSTFTIGLLAILMVVPAFGATINKSVTIEAGSESSGASSVNGSISVGENAVVTGGVNTVNGRVRVDAGASIENASTVNGTVRIGDNVKSGSLSTVNGAVKVGETATIDGEIEAVNGSISVKKGSTVADDVGNVNGQIALSGAEVGGDVSTVTGDIDVVDGSVVKGSVIVEKPSNWGWRKGKNRKPRIVIGPGSTVVGMIDVEREVDLFISESAKVGGVTGVMSMDDAVRFSGERP
jgi:DUF4097 and DUF4098 domain-containing protein YvlB